MNIAVRGLFATPVEALEVPDAEERNAKLSAVILKKREMLLPIAGGAPAKEAGAPAKEASEKRAQKPGARQKAG